MICLKFIFIFCRDYWFYYFIYCFRSATRHFLPRAIGCVTFYPLSRRCFGNGGETTFGSRSHWRRRGCERKSRTYNFLRKLDRASFFYDATLVSRGPNFSIAHGNPFSRVKMSLTDVTRPQCSSPDFCVFMHFCNFTNCYVRQCEWCQQ